CYGPRGWRRDGVSIWQILRQRFALRELRVSERSSRGGIGNFSGARDQFVGRGVPFAGGLREEQIARGGSGSAKLRRHVRSGAATECAHVERSERGVSHDHANAGEGNAEFVGDGLRER